MLMMGQSDHEASLSLTKTPVAPSPLPSISLSRDHITEAFRKSPDGGTTLTLTHQNLTDVGEDGASELASVGQTGEDNESRIVRYVDRTERST
jgi:hypothetical protein